MPFWSRSSCSSRRRSLRCARILSDGCGTFPTRRPDDYLYISNVFHKTFFALDEKGIEAAAATAVVMMKALSMPVHEDPIEVRADKPFIFAVQHVPTGACLFLGRLSDPR